MYRKCIVICLLLILIVAISKVVERVNCFCFGLNEEEKVYKIIDGDKILKDIDTDERGTISIIVDRCKHHRYMIKLYPEEQLFRVKLIE